MRLRIIALFLIFAAVTINAAGSDYADVGTILKAGSSAVNKTADLELKFVYLTEKDSKLFMANNSPACNLWVKYKNDQASSVKKFVKDHQYTLRIKITYVGRFTMDGELIEIM